MGSDNVIFSDWLFFPLTIMPWDLFNCYVPTVCSCLLLSVFHGIDVPQFLKQFTYYRTICLFPVWFSVQSENDCFQSCTNSLRPHGLKHARLPCPSSSPRAWANACPLSQWYYPIILSSVVPFFCLQSFPALGSFPMSRLFASGGQSIGASASASVLPMNIQDWFPLGLTGLISLQSKGLSSLGLLPKVALNNHIQVFTWTCFIFSGIFRSENDGTSGKWM